MKTGVLFATVPLSGTVSTPFQLQEAKEAMLWIPTVDSGAGIAFRAAWDINETNSSNFLPVQRAFPNSGAVALQIPNAGVGSGAVPLIIDGTYMYPGALKVVMPVPQTAIRTLCMIVKW